MWTDSPAGLLLPNMPSSGLNDVVRARVDPVSGVITVNGSIDVDVRAYGVVADGLNIPGFTVNGSGNTGAVFSSSPIFTQADIGKQMLFHQGFTAGGMAAYSIKSGRITAVTDAQNCTIASTACPTYTTNSPKAVFGTDNGDAINAAVATLSLSPSGGTLIFPTGVVLAYKYKYARANSTVYAPSITGYVTRNTPNGFYYKCIVGGISGAAEPTYVDTFGATFTDGTVTWQCMGRTSINLPAGSHIIGKGKAIAVPYGFATTGSVLIGAGYDANYALVILNGKGSTIQNITLDAAKGLLNAVIVSGTSCAIINSSLMRGQAQTLNNSSGSTEVLACQIMGGLDAVATVKSGGDAKFSDCIIAGAGNGFANVHASSVTDDFSITGCHLYKGGWGLTLSTVAGPNLLFESLAAGTTGGGTIIGNTFDTALGNHIDVNVSGAGVAAIQALTISGNQFYQPQEAFTTNTYSCINVTCGATPAIGVKGLSISGNVAKGTPAGNQYKSFVNWNVNAATNINGSTVLGNAIYNTQALYSVTGAAFSPGYSAGNAWTTSADVTTIA